MGAERPTLRPYQLDVIARLKAEVAAGRRRVLAVAPTGAGKTEIATAEVDTAIARCERVLFLAHRRELVHQAVGKLWSRGIDAGVILAGCPARPGEPVQVASVQTLWARAVRSRVMELPSADLVFVDEAHHVRADSYRKILDSYPDAVIVGLTATPCRGDGRGLGNVFDALVECPQIEELIGLGFLVPTRCYAPSRPDLEGVHVRHGDYVEAELAKRMDRQDLVGDIVEHWLRLAERRRTVVFATSVAHSVHLRNEFRRSDVLAEHVDGGTPHEERAAILSGLATGAVEVVVNCMVLTEGFDLPELGCIVLARPTKSMGLYRQMIGRGLRPAPGKSECIVLDHSGAVFEHGLPEEPIIWSLDQDRRAVNPMQASRGRSATPALTTCPECHGVRRQGQACSICGWLPRPKPESFDVRAGDLARIDRSGVQQQPVAGDPDVFYRQMLWIAREKGRKPGWAYYAACAKFGAKLRVNRHAVPVPPEPAVRRWVLSRDIAYARAKTGTAR